MKLESLARKHYLSIYLFIVLILIVLAGFMDRAYAAEESEIAELMTSMNIYTLAEPVEAPAFTLQSIDGESIKLDQLRGNVVVLSFWATW